MSLDAARRDRPRGPARLGPAALRPGTRPLGAAGARAGAVSLRDLGDHHRAAAAAAAALGEVVDGARGRVRGAARRRSAPTYGGCCRTWPIRASSRSRQAMGDRSSGRREPWTEPPMGLLAELTHRCPLQCPYCSNPLELERATGELDDRRMVPGARRGGRAGRPAAPPVGRRADRAPRSRGRSSPTPAGSGLYTNLITAGVLLDERADRSAARGRAGARPAQPAGRRAGHRRSGRRLSGRAREEARRRARRACGRAAADDQRRRASAKSRPARGDDRRWRSSWARIGSRWPMSSIMAGRC